MKDECIICGAPLKYLENDELMECAICHKKENSKTACENDHYICNESIGTEEIPELPDKTQLILVYCRSGRRSKEASEKLVKLGYTNIVEFGGILDWTGEIEK